MSDTPNAAHVLRPQDGAVALAEQVCNIESVSGNEKALAEAVEQALRGAAHLEVVRDGDAVMARTNLGRPRRIFLAGHLDTVPVAGNLPITRGMVDGQQALIGRGTCDMKSFVAIQVRLALELDCPDADLTWIFYDHEEVAAHLNGLGRLTDRFPHWFEGDFAILGEPTAATIEGGCKGSLRVEVTTRGKAAHSGRPWMGVNAIHAAGPVLTRLAEYQPKTVTVDGLEYREGLSATLINSGVAANVIPDTCTISVNYRFAPNLSTEQAEAHVREVLHGLDVDIEVTDAAPAARPGLDLPAAQEFVAAARHLMGEVTIQGKQGWTDVARFSAAGIPAVNFGPADPLKAHADDEYVPVHQIEQVEDVLRAWLGSSTERRSKDATV